MASQPCWVSPALALKWRRWGWRICFTTAWDRLLAWAQVGTAALQTQAQLVEVWQIKQPSVSQTLQQLIEAGAVEALPRRGREPIQYLMTGTAQLAL